MTVAPASAVPLITGAVLLVVAALVTEGAVGAVVSMVRVWLPAAETLPAASVAVTETALEPLALRLSVPLLGVAEPRLTLHVPPLAVVV